MRYVQDGDAQQTDVLGCATQPTVDDAVGSIPEMQQTGGNEVGLVLMSASWSTGRWGLELEEGVST